LQYSLTMTAPTNVANDCTSIVQSPAHQELDKKIKIAIDDSKDEFNKVKQEQVEKKKEKDKITQEIDQNSEENNGSQERLEEHIAEMSRLKNKQNELIDQQSNLNNQIDKQKDITEEKQIIIDQHEQELKKHNEIKNK
ncbi:unnamed protein product, partial [Didymodactylos carnosus]